MAYLVSDLYKEAIAKESRVTKIDGEITTSNGTVITVDNNTIDQGSFYITNQCVNSDAFAYGSVFTAEAGITLKTEIDRYSLFDAEIKLFFSLLLSNNEYEKIPLGVFYVNEPSRVGKNITIKAYDGMIKLDKNIEESTTGTVFELLNLVGEKCDIEIAQTEGEILALVNSDILLSVNMDRIETYRDLVAYIGQVTCTFAIFDREGKLRLCEYGVESVKTIQAKLRSSSKFSDFETYYSSASAYFISDSVYKLYGHVEEGSGLLYEMGEVPIIQGLDETNQLVLDNIYTKLSEVRYTPLDITFNGDPSLDLGDKIINVDRFGNEITSLITFYKWTYRGRHQIKSAGINPKLASVKEKKNKDLANLQASINAKTVAVYTYTNARNISVKGGTEKKDMKQIINISFAVNEDMISLFMATINFKMDYDGFVELHSYLDGIFYDNSVVTQYCHKGNNVITIMNYIPCKSNTTYRFEVVARTYHEETDIRVLDAKTKTNENARDAIIASYKTLVEKLKDTESDMAELDSTISYDIAVPITNVPTMTIDKFNAKAAIFGQGLSGEVEWDGTLTFNDEINILSMLDFSLPIKKFSEKVSITKGTITPYSITESIRNIDFSLTNLHVKGFSDSFVEFGSITTNYTVEEDKAINYEMTDKIVIIDGSYRVRDTYHYESEPENIDSGALQVLRMDNTVIEEVQEIEVEVVQDEL